MANTFLNTGTVAATSNPEANLQQINTNNQMQPMQQNNQVQSAQTNTINPITIPIQIQPQVASTGLSQTTNTNSIQALQTNQNVNQSMQPNTNVAPTPQTYNANNTNTKVVDFNQIYNNYQSAYGNNQNANGVKKTSIGTTIVTPTTNNLNTVKGQYQSAYSDTINSLISEMLTKMNNGFQYDPTQDDSLKVATEYAANSTLQSLAGSGVLNSSATAERVARIVSELIPTYEEKAHDRWVEYLGQLADTAQIVMGYDSQQFEYWKDAKDREFQEKEFNYQKQQDELENAWKRVDELGYVDNTASTLLGIKVGTLSKDARMAKEEREFELKKMREQAQIEYENNKALYKLRAELDKEQAKIDFEYNKQLKEYQNNLDKQNAEYEYQLASKYGSTKTNNNYSAYDEIIKNRYAEYDDFTKQYVVPDENTYNELANYLDTLYASGQITESDFLKLSAKYSTYSNKISVSSNGTTSSSAGLNSSNLSTWIKALDGNNKALDSLGVTIWGQKKSNVNNNDAQKAVKEALRQIEAGEYKFTNNQQLMNDLKNHKFGHLGWGL